jgi:protein TonB
MLIRTRHLRSLTGRRVRGTLLAAALGVAVAGCTITPPPRASVPTPAAAINSATLDQYRDAVARRIIERNPSYVLRGTPQAMLRSLVVVSFTVDSNGHVLESSVYRSPACGAPRRCRSRPASC